MTSLGGIDRECVQVGQHRAVEPLLRHLDEWTDVLWSQLHHDLENAHRNKSAKGVYGDLGAKATLALLDALDEEETGTRSTGFLSKPWEHGEDPFWVEHIFPQKERNWRRDLEAWGSTAEEMKTRLHSLGNLTALPSQINKEISNHKFVQKRATVAEDQDAMVSNLQTWVSSDNWVPASIDDRTHELVTLLMARWPDPSPVPDQTLDI
jgi:hypothetical protein